MEPGEQSGAERGGVFHLLHPLLHAHRRRAARGGPASCAARLRAAAVPPLVRESPPSWVRVRVRIRVRVRAKVKEG